MSNLNNLDQQKYNYGITPNEAVAEQNQTFFTYFTNVEGTSPIIIDQTSYSIKYLIDTNGSIVNPEPDAISNRPQAIGLYNLLNNFESGKNAVVKLIESDPLYTPNPNDDALVGKHPITHVGRLALLATSEIGIGNVDYLHTMSFQEFGTFVQQQEDATDFSFLAKNALDLSQEIILIPPVSSYGGVIDFTDVTFDNAGYYNGTNTYIFGENTADSGLEVSFEAKIGYQCINITNIILGNVIRVRYWIEYSEDGGSNWNKLSVFPTGPTEITGNNYTNQGYLADLDTVYVTEWTPSTFSSPSTPRYYNTIKSYPRAFTTGDRVRVQYSLTLSSSDLESAFSTDFVLFGAGKTTFALINSTGYVNETTFPYFDDVSAPTTSPPFLPQFLTASLNFSAFINNNYVQILPTASVEFNYQQSTYPLNIQPGDRIRCEYNTSQVATIVEVIPVNETPSRTCLKIFPPVIPDGATLDHFTIYRIVNDGSNIILNVPTPVRGNSFSGVIQPEFVSKELVDKYDKIIIDLTEREIIQ